MGLESGTLFSSLNPAWPLGGDDLRQGDDHLRLLKTVLTTTFTDSATAFNINKGGATYSFDNTGLVKANGVQLATVNDVAARVAKAGDSMSGNLNLIGSNPSINLVAPTGHSANLVMGRGVLGNRWVLQQSGNAESGANVGSDLTLYRYDDAGANPISTLTANRANGFVVIPNLTSTTQTAGDNTTKAATTAFVTAANALKVSKTGDTMTGNLSVQRGTDSGLHVLFAGLTKGVRFTSSPTVFTIEGVDQTGVGSYQPLHLSGSQVTVIAPPAGDNSLKVANTAFVQSAKPTLDRVVDQPVFDYSAEQIAGLTTSIRACTATYVNSAGEIATAAINEARIAYDPTTLAKKGLMMECQRINMALYSQDLDNAAWIKTRSSITANVASTVTVAPDTTATVDKLVEDATATNTHHLTNNYNASASTAYTFSVFLKAGERTRVQLQTYGNSGGNTVEVNLTAKTATLAGGTGVYGGWTAGSCTITEYINGWFRVSMTATTNAGLTVLSVTVALEDATGAVTYTGDGVSGAYVWGMQLEAGIFPTSYIPTTTAAVTRLAESSINLPIPSFPFNDNTGTVIHEFVQDGMTNSTVDVVMLISGPGNNYIQLRYGNIIAGTDLIVASGTVSVDSGSRSFTAGKLVKSAVAWAVNDIGYTWDGAAVEVDTVNVIPVGMTTFALASTQGTSAMCMRRVIYYPKRLVNADLQALTTAGDSALASVASVNTKLTKTGDTMTGTLAIRCPTPTLLIDKPASGDYGVIYYRTGILARWALWADTTAESANGGSDFRISRYNDAGSQVDTPFLIQRNTGLITLLNGATTLAPSAGDNSNRVATTAYVKTAVDAGTALTVLKAGDTMTGGLQISPVAAHSYLALNAPAGFGALLYLSKSTAADPGFIQSSVGGKIRWQIIPGIVSTETGSNIGSDFQILRFNDAGTYLDVALQITRADGTILLNGPSTTYTPTAGDNSTRVATTAFVAAALAAMPSGGATISDTAPGSPTNGMMWWNSANGAFYIYYNDGSSSQWVQINMVGG